MRWILPLDVPAGPLVGALAIALALTVAPTPARAQARAGLLAFDVPATAYATNTGYLPFVVAQAKGFFEQQGLKPNIIASGGGGIALRAFTASDAPLGVEGVPSTLAAVEGGGQFRIVGQFSQRSDIWVAVRAGSSIQSVADLKGKKIGVSGPNSTLEAIAKAMLRKAGLTEKDAQIEYLGNVPTIILALERGLIDVATGAGQIQLAYHTRLANDWRLLGRGDDFFPTIDGVLVAKDTTIRDTPQLVRGFLAALQRAKAHIVESRDPRELIDIVNAWQKITDPKVAPVVRAMVEGYAVKATADQVWGDFDPDLRTIRAIATDLVERGVMKKMPEDWSRFVDLRFVTPAR